jgi:hypothetical protein
MMSFKKKPHLHFESGITLLVDGYLLGFYRAIALMMEAASTSETSVNFCQTTRRNNSEDSPLHTPRRENLKSHQRFSSERVNPELLQGDWSRYDVSTHR